MALVLVAGGLLFGWQLFALPVRIADAVAGIGLVAHEMVSGNGSGLFAPNGIGLPGLSHLVTAIFIRLYGDAFAGTRLAGWFAGMALLVATWALSRELLRRTRVSDARGNVLEDDGGWPAIFAVAVLAAGYSMIHFARLPLFLESVVWGTLALWALLRGLRRSSLLLLTLSGLFTGLAMILTPVGMVYLAGVPLTWFGVIVLQPRLVERRLGGVGVAGPLLWIGALLVIMAPILGYWSRQAGYFGDYLQAVDALGVNPAALPVAGLWANLKRTILTFNLTADASLLFGYPGHLLDSALAPLFVLGVGALLFNLDRLLGWVGIFMLATGLMVGAVMAPATPYWPLLLPLLPFSALAIAFAVDRLWALLLDVAGVQFQQIFVVVIFGLLLWAVGNNWLDYYQFAALDGNPASHTAHAVRATALERTVGLVIVEGANAVSWADPPLALVAVERAPESQLELLYGAWPGALPAGSRLLVQPADRWLLTDLAQAYPGGVASVERDMRANPVIYMYDLP
jgi:hypothetical protein